MDRLGLPRTNILAYTLPGFATGEATKANAWRLMKALGVTGAEIDIRPAARQMLQDIGHASARGEALYDVTLKTSRPDCAPTICSGWPTTTAVWWSAPAICRSWGSAGAPMASATRCRITTPTPRSPRP